METPKAVLKIITIAPFKTNRPSIEELNGLYSKTLGEITEQDILDHYKILEKRNGKLKLEL